METEDSASRISQLLHVITKKLVMMYVKSSVTIKCVTLIT